MKKLLLLSLLISSVGAYAQITLDKSDFAAVGDTLFYGYDTTNVTVNMATTTGADQSWDYSGAVKNTVSQLWFIDPANSPIQAPANITHVLVDGSLAETSFLDVTNDGLSTVQPNPAYPFVGGEPFIRVKNISLPLQYQDYTADSSSSTSVIAASTIGMGSLFDSVRVTFSVNVNSLCDAWGTLKTAQGTYNSLRLKNTIILNFKFEGKSNLLPMWVPIPVSSLPLPIPETQKEVSYIWFGKTSKYFIAEVNMATDSETERDEFRWQTERPVNSSLLHKDLVATPIAVFPNPATGYAAVTFNMAAPCSVTITVYDVTGKLVRSVSHLGISGKNEVVINTAELNNGLYTIHITDNINQAVTKLAIQK